MTDMRSALADAGIDPARIHTELFGTLPPINPGITVLRTGRRTNLRARRSRTAGVLLAQRDHRELVADLRQHSRTRGGL